MLKSLSKHSSYNTSGIIYIADWIIEVLLQIESLSYCSCFIELELTGETVVTKNWLFHSPVCRCLVVTSISDGQKIKKERAHTINGHKVKWTVLLAAE
jgi:hypothetical protein